MVKEITVLFECILVDLALNKMSSKVAENYIYYLFAPSSPIK